MSKIRNFSRHPFSKDQKKALKGHFGQKGRRTTYGKPEAPFFTSGADLAKKIGGQVGALVVPTDMFLDAHIAGLLDEGTTLVFWNAHNGARQRGRHATTGMKVYTLKDGQWKVDSYTVKPTVEVDFKTGQEFKFEG